MKVGFKGVYITRTYFPDGGKREKKYEPVHDMHEETNYLGFRPGPTQTGRYSHRRW